MSQPHDTPHHTQGEKKNMSLLIRGSLWIAIGALIAAALVCVVWVLIGDQDGLIGRAFLTILLLAGFAGIAILEAGLAPNRPDWLALASMVSWILALIVGAFKIWLPEDGQFFSGGERFFQLLLVVGILQLALLHVRLFTPAASRYVTGFTRAIYIATIVFLVGLVGMLLFFLTFTHNFEFGDLYGRILVALTILTAVGTTLIPLLNALFAPKKTKAAAATGYTAPTGWPTYADGITPLPAMPDGSPDWNAYYTGYPSVPQVAAQVTAAQVPVAQAPQQYGQVAPPAPQYAALQQLPAVPEPVPPVAAEPVAPVQPVAPAQPAAPAPAVQVPPAPVAAPEPVAPPAAYPPAPPLPPQ